MVASLPVFLPRHWCVVLEILRSQPWQLRHGFCREKGNHQQYLYKVPNGYCGLGGTGISCPVGVVKSSES